MDRLQELECNRIYLATDGKVYRCNHVFIQKNPVTRELEQCEAEIQHIHKSRAGKRLVIRNPRKDENGRLYWDEILVGI